MSMTLEEAIKNREECLRYLEDIGAKATPSCVEAVRWSVKALKVLRPVTREQVEKVFPGCDFCKIELDDYPYIVAHGDYDSSDTCYEPSFCPICGKPLTDEAVDMVIERLEEMKMANRGDVVSVDKLWDVFDREREKAWEGVEAPVATPEWNIAAGKIDVINNICGAVCSMNTSSRSNGEKAEKPVLKDGVSVVHSDYANGTAKTEALRWRKWVCPVCGWFVGERLVHSHIGTHDQQKSNFCSRCGQKIDWEGVQDEVN